jgi:hypothetical protein
MPLSPNPEARKTQLANLKANAHHIHGAHSETALAPLRAGYASELAEAFPSASKAEISRPAHRQALHVLAAWMDKHGVLANKQRGVPFPAVQLHERIAAAFEKQYALLREREQATGEDGQAAIDAVLGAYQVGRHLAGGADNIDWARSKNSGRGWTRGVLPGITKVAGGAWDIASDPASGNLREQVHRCRSHPPSSRPRVAPAHHSSVAEPLVRFGTGRK